MKFIKNYHCILKKTYTAALRLEHTFSGIKASQNDCGDSLKYK